ncbi:hypothetical protein MPSEU_000862200 [Mayamaea pseudoterrestris]|nr:hypothetical protein MPSEU_000862200 [Mayamaea pseudoterrestris]
MLLTSSLALIADEIDVLGRQASGRTQAIQIQSATYYPGRLNVIENGLLLSEGLTSRIIARAGSNVQLDTRRRRRSKQVAHALPDYGATFPDPREGNEGGWIYTSNSENKTSGAGGVGAFTFNARGHLIKYKRVLMNTTSNCGGGTTPWGAYISCEEKPNGLIYQVDPTGVRPSQVITMGRETKGGLFESFAYYNKNLLAPQFFATEDSSTGVVRRFIPDTPDWGDPWSILTGTGSVDYLLVDPTTMTFRWTTDLAAARMNANTHFPNTEGIDRRQQQLYFVTKVFKSMFILNLETYTYTNVTTDNGDFDGQPDQVIGMLGKTDKAFRQEGWLFFTEDGGPNAGIFARNTQGEFYTILGHTNAELPNDETTGLSFSPDGKHMYFALQLAGLTYDISRLDGLPFYARTLNIKYHDTTRS